MAAIGVAAKRGSRCAVRGGRLELGSLFDLDAERVGDVAQPGQAGRAVPIGFVPLDLMLGHSERLGQLPLGPAASDTGLDHGGQFGKRGGSERRHLPAAQLLVVRDLRTEVLGLCVDRVELELAQLRGLPFLRGEVGSRLLEPLQWVLVAR